MTHDAQMLPPPKIVPECDFVLPRHYTPIIQDLFRGRSQVLITKVYNSGFGGCYVLEVAPFIQIGNGSKPQLRAVIKLGPTDVIQQEVIAFASHIQNYLPLNVPIAQTSASCRGSFGGLCYHLAGDGVFDVYNLCDYLNDENNKSSHVETLFSKQLLRALWKFHHNVDRDSLEISASYDKVLSPNLVLTLIGRQPEQHNGTAKTITITPDNLRTTVLSRTPTVSIDIGDVVRLERFVVTEVDVDQQTITLNTAYGHEVTDKPKEPYRVRIEGLSAVNAYAVGQPIEQLFGRVSMTRHTFFAKIVETIRNTSNQLHDLLTPDGTLQITAHTRLPNPFAMVPTILLSTIHAAAIYKIHGDLNVNNILVSPDNGTVYIIDHALSRIDHVLHDYLRIEVSIFTKFLAPLLIQGGEVNHALVWNFFMELHRIGIGEIQAPGEKQFWEGPIGHAFSVLQMVRRAAWEFFENRQEDVGWTEYYKGLLLYLVGAMKFKELTPAIKQAIFVGAASTGYLINELESPLQEELPLLFESVPQEIFDFIEQADGRTEQFTFGAFELILLRLGEAHVSPVRGGGIHRARDRAIKVAAVASDKVEITATSWNIHAETITIGNLAAQTYDPWPHDRHALMAQRVPLDTPFYYNGNIRRFAHTHTVVAVYFAKHQVLFDAHNSGADRFIILVIKSDVASQ